MDERRLAHHARRRRNASGQPHAKRVQLLVRELELFRCRLAVVARLRFKAAEFFDYGADRILAPGLDDLAALKLIRIDIPDELAQRLEVLSPGDRLIVIFDE